jgi:hypothetical protein
VGLVQRRERNERLEFRVHGAVDQARMPPCALDLTAEQRSRPIVVEEHREFQVGGAAIQH